MSAAPHLAAYSASKGALMTLTKNTANAVNMMRIRVNGIILGWADTPGEHETLKKFHDATDDWLEKAEAEPAVRKAAQAGRRGAADRLPWPSENRRR